MLNPRFLQHKKACFVQALVALVFISVVLCALDDLSRTTAFRIIGATSLSASTFIVFATCNNSSARIHAILGGYLIGAVVGLMCYLLSRIMDLYVLNQYYLYTYEFVGAVALAMSLLLMVIFDVQHPPAAGLSVGVVIDVWDADSFIVITAAVIALAALRVLLKDKLVHLV